MKWVTFLKDIMVLPSHYIWITFLCLLQLMGNIRTLSNDILSLDIPGGSTEPPLDANTVCKNYPGLTPRQYEICAKYPDAAASAIQGIQIAIHECQYQFKHHRWNCSALERKNKNPHSSPALKKGYKEAAFAYAIIAAGMITQVSRACAMGKVTSCGCNAPVYNKDSRKWSWDGCDNNIHFGERYTKNFLDSGEEKSKDLLARTHLHNNRVGRMAVKQHSRRECKCHGMSGSCELKTCWESGPTFREIGDLLYQQYHGAIQVDNTNKANGKLRPLYPEGRSKRKTVSKKSLVYFEKSPNYCDHDASIDVPGTSGRYCNKSSKGIDNCETLCCGRGYATLRVTRTERCHCKFHWCCYVKCDECRYDEWVTVCK